MPTTTLPGFSVDEEEVDTSALLSASDPITSTVTSNNTESEKSDNKATGSVKQQTS